MNSVLIQLIFLHNALLISGNMTKVLFNLTVMSLDTIDESITFYPCDIFFAQSWKDYCLMLPDNSTSEYVLLLVKWLTEIWRPESFLKNVKSITFQTITIPIHYISSFSRQFNSIHIKNIIQRK